MINSLKVTNFRTFPEIEVDYFGRVNLIVGKNNAGKTALMEAIQFYIRGADSQSAIQYLSDKDEIISFENTSYNDDFVGVNFAALFNNGNIGFEEKDSIVMIDKSDPSKLLKIYTERVPLNRRVIASISRHGIRDIDSSNEEIIDSDENISEFALALEQGSKKDYATISDALDRQNRIRRGIIRKRFNADHANIMNVPSNAISQNEIARLWDNISLTESEEKVLNLIRKVAPVDRISFVQRGNSRSDRIVLAKLANHNHPIPLKSMGEGISRIIQIALILESNATRNVYMGMNSLFSNYEINESYLFIDELENGIHFSVLDEIWKFIFTVAETRGIQVFVTSHSWDCIESFQRIANRFSSLGVLVNVGEKNGRKIATCFDEKELEFISKNSLEVR